MFGRVKRKVYDLAVRAGLAKYRRPWAISIAQWDTDYAEGTLDYYGAFEERGRFGTVVALMGAFPRKPRVLEIGCGVSILRDRTPDDMISEYIGLDPAAAGIAQASARNFPNTRFEVLERPTPDMGTFDIIVLNEMMCLLDDLPGLLEYLKPYLKPDGWLITSMFRHPGDVYLHRTVAEHYPMKDQQQIVRISRPLGKWHIGVYTAPGTRPN